MLQNAKQKPKVLFSQALFTQSANQRFTLQAVSTQIGGALDFAKKQLVAEKIIESQAMSKKMLQRENDYIRSQYADGDNFLDDFNTQIKEYELHIQGIPKYLMTKLQEYTEKRIPEDMRDGAKKEEDKEDEGEEEKEEGGKKKKGGQRGKKASVSKKGVKKEEEEKKNHRDDEDDDDYEDGLRRMAIEDNKKWDMYEHNSEEDEKEWFKEDFGRGPEGGGAGTKKGGKKNAEKKTEKPKGRGKGKAKKDSDEESDYTDITANTPAQKRGGAGAGKRRTVVDDDEDEMEDESPMFKKTKKTPTQTPPPAQTNTQNKSKASKPINKFFL